MANYNVRQVTNYDLKNAPELSSTAVPAISIPQYNLETKRVEMVGTTVPYKTAVSNSNIIKLGYCCEQKGIDYPIFLEIEGEWKRFHIGKTGMFEIQPEEYLDADEENTDTLITKTAQVIITGVRVPANIRFTLDYVVLIN